MSHYTRIPNALIFSLRGKHSARYLHNRLTNEIVGLAKGSSCQAFALTPQGKIEGFYLVKKINDEELYVVLDAGNVETSYEILNRYHVSEPFIMKYEEGWELLHLFSAEAEIDTPPELPSATNIIHSATRRRAAHFGVDVFGPSSAVTELAVTLQSRGHTERSLAELQLRSARAGVPWYPEILQPGTLLSTGLIPDTISFKKGCYVGQEVMEKLDARGQHPRPLCWFAISSPCEIPIGTSMQHTGEPNAVGEVLFSVVDADSQMTFGFGNVRHSITSPEGITIAGHPPAQLATGTADVHVGM